MERCYNIDPMKVIAKSKDELELSPNLLMEINAAKLRFMGRFSGGYQKDG